MANQLLDNHRQALFDLLAYTSGHLQATSQAPEHAIQRLQETLAGALVYENIDTIKSRFFSAENSDLFFHDALAPEQRARLENLAIQAEQESAQADRRVFVRDVPVRTSQISGSVPLWANGAAVDETLGPFLNKDGRQIWFDFFKITRLVALYVEGHSDPAILFTVSLSRRFINDNLPLVTEVLPQYHLLTDSVWINSALLASNAPAGHYTGLKIKSGDITLSAPPQISNGKLTISATTTATVTLHLDQSTISDADPASPYGIDARNAILHLPEQLAFHFSGIGGTIDLSPDKLVQPSTDNLPIFGGTHKVYRTMMQYSTAS